MTAATAVRTALTVPTVGPDTDNLTAALAYAAAGWYVLPTLAGSKHPGSVVRDGWQHKSSREPDQIVAWWAGTDHGIALHVGRSGAVVFDIDAPDRVPDVLAAAIKTHQPPRQTTRPDNPARVHVVFAVPSGRRFGNGTGRLGGAWGEVRGDNGVIIVAPSVHKDAADGAAYGWAHGGSVPLLPDELDSVLPDGSDAVDAATDTQVAAFLAAHRGLERPELLNVWCRTYTAKVDTGASRHASMLSIAAGAMKEARAGYIAAQDAANTLESLFLAAVARQPAGDRQGAARSGSLARSEWAGILSWAVGQAEVADLAEVRARVETKVPERAPADLAPGAEDSPSGEAASGKKSVATQLVDLAVDRWRFGLSAEGEPFALPLHGAQVVRMLTGSRSIRAELGDLFQARTGKVAGQQALADAVLTLEGRARRVEPVPLALRVAGDDGTLWLDLGTLTGEAVRITANGWQVEPEPPVLFRRTALSGVLPQPVAGGDLNELWTLLNVAPESRPVLLAWLVAALLPDIPHPVAALVGEQGTGKSTASRMLTGLLDPSPAQLRKPPRDVDGWTTAAAGSWVVGVDNVSAISDWWSDSLCRAVTGDGDVRRRLYSDADLTVFAFRRVVLLNGVDLGTVRDDLADRLLTVELHRIAGYKLDVDIAHVWARSHPRILGALLDLAVKVLGVLPGVQVADLPRMADYARVLAAVDQVLGTDGLATYRQLAADLAADAVTGDPVLSAITETLTAPWVGTAAELLGRLGERPEHGKAWPKTARAVTGLLRRKAPSLRRVGWDVDDLGRQGKACAVHFRLTPPDASSDRQATGKRQAVEASDDACSASDSDARRLPTNRDLTCEDAENTPEASDASEKPAPLLLDLMNGRRESVETTPYEIGGEWSLASLAAPAPSYCATCAVELTPARAGRNTRCETCWQQLLANQPEAHR